MSFNDYAAELVASGDLGVGFLIDDSGQQFWTVGTWDGFDPLYVLNEWKKPQMGAIQVGNLRFTTIGKGPEKLVSTNVQGQGHLIGAKCSHWPGYVIAWCPATNRPDVAYTVVQKLADLVRS